MAASINIEKTNDDNDVKVLVTSSPDLRNLSSSLQDLFSALNAEVETSRFIIAKVDDGTSIDFAFKAIIRSKKNNKKVE